MDITPAAASDVDEAVGCLAKAFAQDPITGFLLQTGAGYPERLTQFFSLLMRARIALQMPVLLARDATGIHGAAMGYTTERLAWPDSIAQDWDRFEQAIPGLGDRLAAYDAIATQAVPPRPHHYLGVIGVDPVQQGLGIGKRLLRAFCDLSASNPLSGGVYLETATPSNLPFYAQAGFVETGRGPLGNATLWCLFLEHRPADAA